MKEKYETYAYFWIEGDELPHEEISQALGLEPTSYWNKGDPSIYVTQRNKAGWEFRSALSSDEIYIDAHLVAVVDALYGKSEVIANLKKKYELGINCVGYFANANPGFHLDQNLLQKCAKLDISIDFDLYCLNKDDNESTV